MYLGNGTTWSYLPPELPYKWRHSFKKPLYSSSVKIKSGHEKLYVLTDSFWDYLMMFLTKVLYNMPITVAARSKASTVFARSKAGIVGSNHTRGIDVCLC
jgi:hypothetical protein